MRDPETPVPPTAVRIIRWPTHDGHYFDTADTSLTDADADELRFYAEHYAGLPLRELMRRLRLAEWDAAYYRREAEEARQAVRELPPMYAIREMDARYKRIRGLLTAPGRISRADLQAALNARAYPSKETP